MLKWVLAFLIFSNLAMAQTVPLITDVPRSGHNVISTRPDGTPVYGLPVVTLPDLLPLFGTKLDLAGGLSRTATNASLKSLAAGSYRSVYREGFSASGDGGSAIYTFAPANCSSPDNGAQVQPTVGTGCWLLNSFGPFNPRVWGAKGDGVTDDAPAIQATVNAAQVQGGNAVHFGRGYYCIKSAAISVTNQGVTLSGENRYGASVLDVCGANHSAVIMSGFHDEINALQIVGSQTLNTLFPAVVLNSGCSECTVYDSLVSGGSYAVYVNCYEAYILYSRLEYSYGTAVVYWSNSGGYMTRDKIDQSYPAGTPSRNITITPWAALTSYTARQSLVTSGNYIMQAMTSGSSGPTLPVPPTYSTSVTDGGVTWKLVGNTTHYGVQFDTGSGANAYISDTDFSSALTWAIGITNGYAGAAPFYITLDKNTIASELYGGIVVSSAASKIQITNTAFGGCLLVGCSGIQIGPTAVGDMQISGNLFDSYITGIYLGAGKHYQISNNNVGATTTALSVQAPVTDWSAIGNHFGASALYGPNETGIYVAPGSDYYIIQGNDSHEATTPLNYQAPAGSHVSVGSNL